MWLLPYSGAGRVSAASASTGWPRASRVAAVVAAISRSRNSSRGRTSSCSFPAHRRRCGATQQIRGGLLRVEGAFGHSIALGGSARHVRGFVAVACAGRHGSGARSWSSSASPPCSRFSRLGLIGFALTVAARVLFLGRYVDRALRIALLAILGDRARLALPVLLRGVRRGRRGGGGQCRIPRSTCCPLIDSMVVLGISPSREVLATGEDYWGGFRSIDSALILIGLRFGLLCLAIVVLLLVHPAGRRSCAVRGSPASVALVAQIPAFATVALITQYAVFVWFTAGLAVASYTLVSGSAAGSRLEDARRIRREMWWVRRDGRQVAARRPAECSAVLVRKWWIIVLAAIIGGARGLRLLQHLTPIYTSSSSIYFSMRSATSGSDINQGSAYTQNQMLSFAQLAMSAIVLDEVRAGSQPRRHERPTPQHDVGVHSAEHRHPRDHRWFQRSGVRGGSRQRDGDRTLARPSPSSPRSRRAATPPSSPGSSSPRCPRRSSRRRTSSGMRCSAPSQAHCSRRSAIALWALLDTRVRSEQALRSIHRPPAARRDSAPQGQEPAPGGRVRPQRNERGGLPSGALESALRGRRAPDHRHRGHLVDPGRGQDQHGASTSP